MLKVAITRVGNMTNVLSAFVLMACHLLFWLLFSFYHLIIILLQILKLPVPFEIEYDT